MRSYVDIIKLVIIIITFLFTSCEEFFDPNQEISVEEKEMFTDWYEYRSAGMGLYGLQQKLVEQLMVLGELRGDLLTVTDKADADLIEVNEFRISRTNKYASPRNFFKLISACNNLIRVIEQKHPEVLDPKSPITNYDRLYGEALCMRAWAYFNAVRIYGKVPYIPETLVTIEEIENFVNSSGTYIDSVHIIYSIDGYYNDTIENKIITLEKKYYDLNLVVDHFANELEKKVKAVGVNYALYNNDASWEVTTWNTYAYYALLGHMYLTIGDLAKAAMYFKRIIDDNSEDRYEVDYTFAYNSWQNIFKNVNNKEHIYVIWFDKGNYQTNNLQKLFYPEYGPNKYMLKPTKQAVIKWETVWRGQIMQENLNNPALTRMIDRGDPGDYYRGYGISYVYIKGKEAFKDIYTMLDLKKQGDIFSAENMVYGYDTVAWKYSIKSGGDPFIQDPFYIIYRAASIHLYLAEVFTYWVYERNGLISTNTINAVYLLNNGKYYTIAQNRSQLGVRGRVGLGSDNDAINITNIVYLHDPYTNEIIGYIDMSGDFPAKQRYFEEQILEERARELAFEGERFYDLMRVAKRRNDPSFLAKKVSEKFSGSKRQEIYNLLLDERNWYINYFEE